MCDSWLVYATPAAMFQQSWQRNLLLHFCKHIVKYIHHKLSFYCIFLFDCKSNLQIAVNVFPESTNTTRCWFSSLVMFSKLFLQLSSHIACSYGFLPSVVFFSRLNALLVGFSSGDWLDHCGTFHFPAMKKAYVAFVLCFSSLSICTVQCHQISFIAVYAFPGSTVPLYCSIVHAYAIRYIRLTCEL